jgi:hypothetical protein
VESEKMPWTKMTTLVGSARWCQRLLRTGVGGGGSGLTMETGFDIEAMSDCGKLSKNLEA